MESATRLDAKDAANKLFGLTAGALVGGALLQSAGGTGAAAAGLGAALLSTFALGWASERRQRSERSTDYTFILDSSLQTLDRAQRTSNGFRLIGRLSRTEPRGCSLGVEDLRVARGNRP